MAWFTTDDGRHVNTDWLSPEDQLKYKQILANKMIADQLSGITHPAPTSKGNYNKKMPDGGDEPEYERSPKMDFLDKRIAGKQKEIEKAEKKLARIKEAQASGWTKNPYYYHESDIVSTEKDLARLQKELGEYKESMQQEISKAKSRNVPAITEFLDDWEKRSIEYFKDQKEKYKEAYEMARIKEREYVDWLNYPNQFVPDYDRTKQEYKDMYNAKAKEYREYRKNFKDTWKHVTQFNDGSGTWEENMVRAVAKEKVAKYDDIIHRTNELIGQITDAAGLEVGLKGDLNGIIKGEKGAVKLETIGAGGYNIQRYHFRTLINPVDVEQYNRWKKWDESQKKSDFDKMVDTIKQYGNGNVKEVWRVDKEGYAIGLTNAGDIYVGTPTNGWGTVNYFKDTPENRKIAMSQFEGGTMAKELKNPNKPIEPVKEPEPKKDDLIPFDKWEAKPNSTETFYDNGSNIPRTVHEYDETRYVFEPDVRSVSKKSTLEEVEAWRNDDGTYGQGDESIFVVYDDGSILDLTDGEPHKKWSKQNIKGISVSTGDYMQVWGEEYDKKNKQWIPLETYEVDDNSNDIPGYSNSFSGRQAVGSYKARVRQTTVYNEKYGRWNNQYETIAKSTVKRFESQQPKATVSNTKDDPAFKTMDRLSKKGISTSWEIENWLRGLSPQRRNRLAVELGIANVRGEDKLKLMVSKIFGSGKD